MSAIFIHVPKTGGVTVKSLGWAADFGHMTAEQIRDCLGAEGFAAFPKFAFWRNPLARLVSTFFFFRQLTRAHEWFAPNQELAERICAYTSFGDFVRAFEADGLGGFYHFQPQHQYLCIGDRLAVNFLGLTERLSSDLAVLAVLLRKPIPEAVPVLNASRHEPWLRFYTSTTLAWATWYYREDFALLEKPRLEMGAAV